MSVNRVINFIQHMGLSTDIKPTTGLFPGVKYLETDTGFEYLWDGFAWTIQKASPVGGSKTVTTSGTGVALVSSSTKAKSLYVRAKSTNTGYVYFGDSSVDKTSSKQIMLTAGQSVSIDAPAGSSLDVSEWYVDSEVNSEGVDFLYL